MKKKQTQAQKNAKRRQARLDRQYRELISNYKNIYNSLQLAATLGANTPSPEKVLNEAGTRSGLIRPTAASIKALKKVQTTTGVLRQALAATPQKAEGRERLKEKFEESYERDQRMKKPRKRKKKKEPAEDVSAPKPSDNKPSTPSNQKEPSSPVGGGGGYNSVDVVLEQLQDYIDRIGTQKYHSNADMSVLATAEDLIQRINFIRDTGNDDQNAKMEEGANKYFAVYRQITYQELYSDAPNLRPLLFDQVVKTLSEGDKQAFEIDFRDYDYYQ